MRIWLYSSVMILWTICPFRIYAQESSVTGCVVDSMSNVPLRNDITYQLYDAEGTSQDQHYILWNFGIAKKLLKNQSLEIALNAYDVLRQNNLLSHTVTSTYIEDKQSKMLTSYVMLTLTYTMRPGNL